MIRSILGARHFVGALFATLLFLPFAANADSGFYVGGSIGAGTIEADIGADPELPELPSSIDEDDTAYKIFLGYTFDLPVIDLGIEGGYVDFGKPEVNIDDPIVERIEFDPTGINLWGTAGIEAGPIDLFAKLGYIMWDIEASIPGVPGSISEDGSDIGYGLGAAFNLGSLQIRGEYEIYDIDEADVTMLSVGVAFRF